MAKIGINIKQYASFSEVGGAYVHNERKTDAYLNPHIKKELSYLNHHFILPEADKTYTELYKEKLAKNEISEKGLKDTSTRIESGCIGIESRWFDNDYEKAKDVLGKATDAYIKKIGSENVLSAVMHADEIFTDEKTGKEFTYYHVHITYIPTAVKEKRWSRASAEKDPSLWDTDKKGKPIFETVRNKKTGTIEKLPRTKIKETFHQVSHTRCMETRFGIKNSYSQMQDVIYQAVKAYGLERGEKKATQEVLDTFEYTAKKQRENIKDLNQEQDYLKEQVIDVEQEMRSLQQAKTELFKESMDLKGDIYGRINAPGLLDQKQNLEKEVDSLQKQLLSAEKKYQNRISKLEQTYDAAKQNYDIAPLKAAYQKYQEEHDWDSIKKDTERKVERAKLLFGDPDKIQEQINVSSEMLKTLKNEVFKNEVTIERLESEKSKISQNIASQTIVLNDLDTQIKEKESFLEHLEKIILQKISNILENFWHDVKDAIYFAKNGEVDLAEYSLQTGQKKAYDAATQLPKEPKQLLEHNIDEKVAEVEETYIKPRKRGR